MTRPAPLPDAEVVFTHPWEARVFGIAVSLHQRGFFTWSEWTDALAARIAAGAATDPGGYYGHWLDALEDVLARHGVAPAETGRWRAAWVRAAHRTPHGAPIELRAADFAGD